MGEKKERSHGHKTESVSYPGLFPLSMYKKIAWVKAS